jgi:hypothetical protein
MSKIYTEFPEFIYEALITQVDYESGTCTLSPLSPDLNDLIRNVPLPHHLGASNSGIFHGLEIGSRVVAVQTDGNGREFAVILGTLPKESLYSKNFRSGNKPKNTPSRAIPYPDVKAGRLIVRGGSGNALCLSEDGEMSLSSISNKGLFFKNNRLKTSQYLVAEDQTSFSNAGRSIRGSAVRAPTISSNIFPRKDIGGAPLNSDIDFHSKGIDIGFYTGSRVFNRTWGMKTRNPSITESKTVITEFSEDSRFFGFDNEVVRSGNIGGVISSLGENPKFKNTGNTLDLAPGELIEIIAGNLITNDANILDINFNKLSYGDPQNKVPSSMDAKTIETSKRVSRRGIGYHFQLSTASSSTEKNISSGNFLFDLDKEGVLKVNIPKSSNTGNFPFASVADFSSATPSLSYAQPSSAEPVPVMLRDALGEVVLPDKNSQGFETRYSGVRFSNTDDNPYFVSGGDNPKIVRVNPTKYHNMYAAAERLIANTIDLVNVPIAFVDSDGKSTGIASMKPFEILYPEEFFSEDEDGILASGDPKEPFPLFMSIVAVNPGAPALYTGGDTMVAGVYYSGNRQGKDHSGEFVVPPYSNSFKLEKDGTNFTTSITDSVGNKLRPIGGVSANINAEGAIYSSIGSDNADGKSVLLDTKGSIVSWMGKDNNGRSLITQTDGDVLINVGGSYNSTGPAPEDQTMNIGRFELRVNITDKGFVASEFEADEDDISEDGANPLGASDIMISLSENGIVIAGMKPGLPMVIRNQDKVLIESTGSDVILKGMDVKFVDASGRTKTLKSEGR